MLKPEGQSTNTKTSNATETFRFTDIYDRPEDVQAEIKKTTGAIEKPESNRRQNSTVKNITDYLRTSQAFTVCSLDIYK